MVIPPVFAGRQTDYLHDLICLSVLSKSCVPYCNYYPLFRVRSWNSGVRCMSFYILNGRKLIQSTVSIGFMGPVVTQGYGGVEGPPHFFNIMLTHTDDLVTRPYKLATITISYGGLTNSSVWHRGFSYLIRNTEHFIHVTSQQLISHARG